MGPSKAQTWFRPVLDKSFQGAQWARVGPIFWHILGNLCFYLPICHLSLFLSQSLSLPPSLPIDIFLFCLFFFCLFFFPRATAKGSTEKNSCKFTSCHLTSSHLTSSHLTFSHLTSSHLTSSQISYLLSYLLISHSQSLGL